MNKPEGLDLAGQTFAGEVTLRSNCNGERELLLVEYSAEILR
jgi:hypothetical protein